jgi:hypothetical protein
MDVSTISASGASSVQAQLQALLNGNGSTDGSDSDNLLSGVSGSSDNVSISAAGQQASATNPLQADLDKLSKLIAAGDTDGAKKLLQTIEARHKAHAPASSGSSSSSGDDMFADLQKALDSGDLSSAQSALTKLEQKVKSMPPPPPPSSANGNSLNATMVAAYLKNSGDTSTNS